MASFLTRSSTLQKRCVNREILSPVRLEAAVMTSALAGSIARS
jgi:hypothetical protein